MAPIQFKDADLPQDHIELDKRESWRGSAIMRNGGDKIVIKRDTDGHYVHFSARDDCDHGTIIDFIHQRKGLRLGEILKLLGADNSREIAFVYYCGWV